MSLAVTSPKLPSHISKNRIHGMRPVWTGLQTLQITEGACRDASDSLFIEQTTPVTLALSGNLEGAPLGGAETRLCVWACKPLSGAVYYLFSRHHTAAGFAATQPVGTAVRRIGAVPVHTSGDIRRYEAAGDGLTYDMRYYGYNSSAMGVYDSLRVLNSVTTTGGGLVPIDESRWLTPPSTIVIRTDLYITNAGYVFLGIENGAGAGTQQAEHNFVLTREIPINVANNGNFASGSEDRLLWRQTSSGGATVSIGIRGVTLTRVVF